MTDKEYTPTGFFRMLSYAEKHGKEMKKDAIWHCMDGYAPFWTRKVFRMDGLIWVFKQSWNQQHPGYKEEFWIFKMPYADFEEDYKGTKY